MASLSKSSKASRDERERVLKLKLKYENRITIAKHGKESLDAGDYGNALKKFLDYLLIMAETRNVKEIYDLKINMFDSKKELTEMLMISHLFFEMARMYDAVPKFHGDAQKCLEQFVHFTANQPYQVVNSEMVRKHLKKSAFKNPDMFRHAYQQIYVQSKKCYVVTFCYGENHPITNQFRDFKDVLLDYRLGRFFIQEYYRYSSHFVFKWQHNTYFCLFSRCVVSPFLLFLSKFLLPAIMKK